jgi:hypothetical protein
MKSGAPALLLSRWVPHGAGRVVDATWKDDDRFPTSARTTLRRCGVEQPLNRRYARVNAKFITWILSMFSK